MLHDLFHDLLHTALTLGFLRWLQLGCTWGVFALLWFGFNATFGSNSNG